MVIKSWQVCLGPLYDYLDGRWLGHALRKPEIKRMTLTDAARLSTNQDAQRSDVDEVRRFKGWKANKMACAVVGTELICAIVTAWVVGQTMARTISQDLMDLAVHHLFAGHITPQSVLGAAPSVSA